MRVYLIRHTAPDIGRGVCYGRSDIGLAEDFENAKRAVIAKLGTPLALDHVYSSPLQRCLRLAEALAEGAPVVDPRLLEMDFGEWELSRWDDIDRGELDAWSADFVTLSPPGGENLGMVYSRTRDFIGHLLRRRHGSTAVVTHAGVIRCFWACIAEMPLRDVIRVEVDYGDVFEVQLTRRIERSSIRKL